MNKNQLGNFIFEYSSRNKNGADYPVYSVTNSEGFCKGYFDKDVSSTDKTNYKIVPRGYFVYNPSRINVGSIDWQRKEPNVIVSPLYVVFECKKGILQQYLLHFLKSPYGKRLIASNTTGSVRANLKFSTLESFEINVPSEQDQTKILDRLSAIKASISVLKKEIKLLDEQIKSLFNDRRVTV